MADRTLAEDGYEIAREWCGYSTPKWVARFRGEWIDKGEAKSDALMICLAHSDNRAAN
jgi:hypothetical protein